MPPSIDVADELRRLQRAYAAALPARARELEVALARWLDEHELDAAHTVQQLAHGLTGAGASYGMHELSTLGRELTRQMEIGLLGPIERDQIAPTVRQLAGQVTRTMREAARRRVSSTTMRAMGQSALVRRNVSLISRAPVEHSALESLLQGAGYSAKSIGCEAGARAVAAALAKATPDIVLIELALASSAGVTAELAGLRDSGAAVGVFDCDGSFRERLEASRLGAEVVLVPPYEDHSLVELDTLLGDDALPPGRVMIVEDDERTARAYAAILQEDGLIVHVVTDPEHALEVTDSFRPNLILLDLKMPGVSGIEITRVLRQRADLVSTSIVFLSGETNWEVQQEAMRAGADDFLLKPVEARRLTMAVKTRMQRLARLDRRMSRDRLTDLMNQVTFKERIHFEVARALRDGSVLSLAMFDLDHFKAVNDTHGHPAGDRVLRALAQLVRESLRQTDVVARCGGEEFGVLLPNTDASGAVAVMDRVRRAFHDLTHVSAFGEFRVTLSCGIACSPPATDAPALVELADRALYRAKHGGRDQVAVSPVGD